MASGSIKVKLGHQRSSGHVKRCLAKLQFPYTVTTTWEPLDD